MTSRRVTLSDHLALAAKPDDKEYQIHDRSLVGLMLRIQPTGAKSWVFRQRVNGRPKRVTLGSAKTMPVVEARAKVHAYLAADTTFEASSMPKGPTFAEMAGIYMERGAARWKPSTRYTHECYLNSTLLPFFADMPIDSITRADVARWFHDYGRTVPIGRFGFCVICSTGRGIGACWKMRRRIRRRASRITAKRRKGGCSTESSFNGWARCSTAMRSSIRM